MRINSIISIFKSQILQRKLTKPTQKSSINIKDTVKISKSGKSLQKNKAEFLFAKKALSQIPDIREDKVKATLSKIESNYFDNLSVKGELSKKILGSGIFDVELYGNRVISKSKTGLKNVPDIRENKINEIREKLKSNFYSRKDIISQLSDRILKSLGI